MHVILEQALCLYCHILLFVFQNVTKWNLQTWSKFALLHLAVKGLNSIKSDQCEKFLLFTSVPLYFKQSGYKNRPLSTY